MTHDHTITTERLLLTPFTPEHADALFALNSDPEVMRHLSRAQTREETEADIVDVGKRWKKFGYSWWTIFLKDTDFPKDAGRMIGSACLQNLAHKEDAPLEIGWRLLPAYQGKGYATEAGQAVIDFGFERVGVDYLCAVAKVENAASQKVMARLGMRYVGVQTHYGMDCAFYEKTK